MTTIAQAWRFAHGLRALTRDPPTLEQARLRVAEQWRERDARVLSSIQELVFAQRTSPYRQLLEYAGIEFGDVTRLMGDFGLEGALMVLRDHGVYVSHEEWLGVEPARRGSAEFSFSPVQFFNPVVPGDLLVGTGGSRTGGVPVRWSFSTLRRGVDRYLLRAATWDVLGTPAAVWLPPHPSAVGLTTALLLAATGEPAERWFSPVSLEPRRLSGRTRAANRFLPTLATLVGSHVPRPSYAPSSNPSRCWPGRRPRSRGTAAPG